MKSIPPITYGSCVSDMTAASQFWSNFSYSLPIKNMVSKSHDSAFDFFSVAVCSMKQ